MTLPGLRLVPAPDASGMVCSPAGADSRLRVAVQSLTPRQRTLLRSIWAGEADVKRRGLKGRDSTTLLSLVRRGLVRRGDLTAAGLRALGRRADDRRPDCSSCAGLGAVRAKAPCIDWIECRFCAGSGFGSLAAR